MIKVQSSATYPHACNHTCSNVVTIETSKHSLSLKKFKLIKSWHVYNNYIHHLLFRCFEHSTPVNIVSDVEGVIIGWVVRVIPCLHNERIGLVSLYHQLRYQGVIDVVRNTPSHLTCASVWGVVC